MGSREQGRDQSLTRKGTLGRHTSLPGNRAGLSEGTDGVTLGDPRRMAQRSACALWATLTPVQNRAK